MVPQRRGKAQASDDLRLLREETKYAFRSYTEEQRAQLLGESRFGMYLPRPEGPTPAVLGVMAPAPAPLLEQVPHRLPTL